MDNSGKKVRKGKPFYVATGTTSAAIVAEARTSVRSIDTKRPSTPVEAKRTLFGANRKGSSQSRPPSAFSIGPRHFVDSDLSSQPTNRLQPLQHSPDTLLCNDDGETHHILVQVDDKIKKSQLKSSKSIDPLLPIDPTNTTHYPLPPNKRLDHITVSRRSSTGTIVKQKLGNTKNVDTRRVHSGPTKRASPSASNELESRAKSSPVRKSNSYDNNNDSSNPRSSKESLSPNSDNEKNDKLSQEIKRLTELYKENIRPLLKEMEGYLRQGDSKILYECCLKLSKMLQQYEILPEAEAVSSSTFKIQLLKALFSFLHLKEPSLHLQVAKLVLKFNISESNEENIFKLIFKVSRDENNDQLFIDENIPDILIRKVKNFDENKMYEPWIYCIGTLKLLSANKTLKRYFSRNGCIQALGFVMKMVNLKFIRCDVSKTQMTNILIPATAVLRNLADVSDSREVFIKQNILVKLLSILRSFKTDSDVVMNISRILSKMTLYDECCSVVSSTQNALETLVQVLNEHLRCQEIVVRLLFILGNLTAKNDEIRHSLFYTEGSMKSLFSVLRLYFERNIEASKPEGEDEKNLEYSKTEDVLNKVIRVIANLSIHNEVGALIQNNQDIVRVLLEILEVKELGNSEELLLNTVATINNLSYYTHLNDVLANESTTITQLMVGLLVSENMDAMLEAARVCGNFSKFLTARDMLAHYKVDEMMISLLDSGNHEVVYTSCGVLINMMIDKEKRHVLYEEGGIQKLIDVLRDFGKIDWQLSAMVCQTLWNYGKEMSNAYETFGEEETLVLVELLHEYLDEESAFDFTRESRQIESNVQQLLRQTWSDNFRSVGEQLLEKLLSKQSDLVPLEEPC